MRNHGNLWLHWPRGWSPFQQRENNHPLNYLRNHHVIIIMIIRADLPITSEICLRGSHVGKKREREGKKEDGECIDIVKRDSILGHCT